VDQVTSLYVWEAWRAHKTHRNPDHRELIKSHAIEAFSEYFDEARDKERILDLVRKQLDSTSPNTKNKAKAFLKKWAK
jgi:hypothetical protein